MGDRYAATGLVTVSGAPDSLMALNGVAAVRGKVFDFGFGGTGTPADNATRWRVARSTTAAASGTAITEVGLDGLAPAAQLIGNSNITSEPGYEEELVDIGLNARASWRWVAAPDAELFVPADATSAFGIEPTNASGVQARGYIHWLE